MIKTALFRPVIAPQRMLATRAFSTTRKVVNNSVTASKKIKAKTVTQANQPVISDSQKSVENIANQQELKIVRRVSKSSSYYTPEAPKLKSFAPRELRLKALYSGYRPLFLEYRKQMTTLETVGDENPSIWSFNALETEYDETWENIPSEVVDKLKPFDRKLDLKSLQAKEKSVKTEARTGGRKRFLSGRFNRMSRARHEKRSELKRLLKKSNESKEDGEL